MTNPSAKPEVGRFYVFLEHVVNCKEKEHARECLYVNENGFLLGTNEKGVATYFIDLRRFSSFVEYKPPVIHKRYLCWYRSKSTNKVSSCTREKRWDNREMYSWILLSETEVTYEEK